MRVLSLFSGIGLHDLGFERAGFQIAALREAVRYCYDEGKLTREVEDAIDRARGRRALEEKP